MDFARAAMRLFRVLVALSLAFGSVSIAVGRDDGARLNDVPIAALPPEGRDTIALIKKGGPFPFQRDGTHFGNFEKLLPIKAKGYYSEYTVATPGVKNRGARRIVAGKDSELFYTDDHYKSFRRIRE